MRTSVVLSSSPRGVPRRRHSGLTLRYQAGYDHSYYFMASFMADHVAHHARILKA
jgi:S-formylglutathione hydrolase